MLAINTVTLDKSRTIFEVGLLTEKTQKIAFFHAPPLFTPPLEGNALEYMDKAYHSENCIILTSTVFDWSIRVTDTDRKSGDRIGPIARSA